jgi:hypothetical protein
MADSTSSNSTPAVNNTTIATQAAPSVNTSVVRMNTEAASQVFNTPELLELLLSKLEAKDVLLRASLVCHAFKASIDSSPTINKTLEFAVIDFVGASVTKEAGSQSYCRNLWLSSFPDNSISYVALDFSALSVERHLSSPSFRKLRMLTMNPQCDYLSADQLSIHVQVLVETTPPYRRGKYTPPDKCEKKPTIAEMLETVCATGVTVSRLIIGGKITDEAGVVEA